MQETMRSHELSNIDFSQIPGLQQKRTLAFVNHFVITNVQFLNDFMNKCEQKLMHFERKLEKVNAAMVLLEARLSSIPELNTSSVANTTSEIKETATADTNEDTNKELKQSEQIDSSDNNNQEINIMVQNTASNPVQSWPEYDRFVKMVHVGVPVQAVKLKVSLEGLDPNVLDKILSK